MMLEFYLDELHHTIDNYQVRFPRAENMATRDFITGSVQQDPIHISVLHSDYTLITKSIKTSHSHMYTEINY